MLSVGTQICKVKSCNATYIDGDIIPNLIYIRLTKIPNLTRQTHWSMTMVVSIHDLRFSLSHTLCMNMCIIYMCIEVCFPPLIKPTPLHAIRPTVSSSQLLITFWIVKQSQLLRSVIVSEMNAQNEDLFNYTCTYKVCTFDEVLWYTKTRWFALCYMLDKLLVYIYTYSWVHLFFTGKLWIYWGTLLHKEITSVCVGICACMCVYVWSEMCTKMRVYLCVCVCIK